MTKRRNYFGLYYSRPLLHTWKRTINWGYMIPKQNKKDNSRCATLCEKSQEPESTVLTQHTSLAHGMEKEP